MDSKELKLVFPTEEYFQSYLEMQAEMLNPYSDVAEPYMDLLQEGMFPAYFNRIEADRLGIGLKEGWVPATMFWAMLDDRPIGRLHLRHELPAYGGHIGYIVRTSERRKGYAKQILKLGLAEARKMGIENAYLTCDKTNYASRAVITANGGVLDKEFIHDAKEKLGFWIPLV